MRDLQDAAASDGCGQVRGLPGQAAADQARAAVVYDDLTRSLALRPKYGRMVAIARTMARYMAPLLGAQPDNALLVPVPLHRGRL